MWSQNAKSYFRLLKDEKEIREVYEFCPTPLLLAVYTMNDEVAMYLLQWAEAREIEALSNAFKHQYDIFNGRCEGGIISESKKQSNANAVDGHVTSNFASATTTAKSAATEPVRFVSVLSMLQDVNSKGQNALMIAIANRQLSLVKFILDVGERASSRISVVFDELIEGDTNPTSETDQDVKQNSETHKSRADSESELKKRMIEQALRIAISMKWNMRGALPPWWQDYGATICRLTILLMRSFEMSHALRLFYRIAWFSQSKLQRKERKNLADEKKKND